MSDPIDLGALTCDDAFFLESPSQRRTVFSAKPSRAVFTRPEARETSLRDAIYEVIEGTRNKLFVCSFLLDDPGLLERLCRKADELRGGVYVVTSLKDDWIHDELSESESDEPGPSKHQVEPLVRAGAQVRGCPSAHAKFIVADDREAVVSTANFDQRGLTVTGEAGLRITELAEVIRLARFFSRLWTERCDLELPFDPSGRFMVRSTRPSTIKTCAPTLPVDADKGVIWTDRGETLIADRFAAIARTPQRELLLATWSARDLERLADVVLQPIEEAIRRGVAVRVLARARNPDAGGRSALRRLLQLGAEVRGDRTNHAKFIIADRSRGLLFSANIEPVTGFLGGIEVGAGITGAEALSCSAYFDEAFSGPGSLALVDRPTTRDLATRMRARFSTPWPLDPMLEVSCPDEVWNRLDDARRGGPALYRQNGKAIHLLVGSGEFELTTDRDVGYVLSARKRPSTVTTARLLTEWLQERTSPADRRGFCTCAVARARRAEVTGSE